MENQSFEQQAKNIIMEKLIKNYEKSDEPWHWEHISKNPNITIEFIDKYHDKPWDCLGYDNEDEKEDDEES